MWRDADVGRSMLWALASAAALLGVAAWLNAPRVEYAAACAVATAAAAWGALGTKGASRVHALLVVAALAIATVVGVRAQLALGDIDRDWVAYRRGVETRSVNLLRGQLIRTVEELDAIARRALDAPSESERAFEHLATLRPSPEERGVALYEGDRLVAWGGRQRLLADRPEDSVSVSASPFYLALHVSAARGGRRAVATSLIYAIPPADRLAPSLAQHVTDQSQVARFVFTPPTPINVPLDARRVGVRGLALFDVRPVPPTPEQGRVLFLQRSRARVGAVFLVGLLAFVVAAWRVSRSLPWRFGVLAVALACVAILPLNEFSGRTRLFDPSVFFTPLGGRLTANAGALGLTSAFVLLGLLARLRRAGAWRARWLAAGLVALVAVAGPFLLRDLARGIRVPAGGVGSTLWLVWEVPLFLAACAVLLAGALAGGSLLGRRRGLPPVVAPALAAVAAMLGPVTWQAPHQWPWWYTLVWIVAIAALALTRGGRSVLLTTAAVAGLGATTLVWANTTRGRVVEAKRDLASLAEPDATTTLLLQRLAPALIETPPTTRQALLQRYVTSDLAASGHPVLLLSWLDGVGPLDAMRTADVRPADSALASIAAEARATGQPVLRTLAERPAAMLALAVAGPGDTTAIAVVAPRTRLIEPDPIVQLLGVEGGTRPEPPYDIQLGPASNIPFERWRRVGNELHGDMPVELGEGMARAHVEVELRSIDALVERGALLVVLNLAIVGALWFVAALADGGVGRWLRVRRRSWRRSYRLRLTVALFGFFVVPAAAFATWSYRQLAADAHRSRELLVRETLRAADPSDDGGDWLERESVRLGARLLRYDGGELSAASDPLYESLAPLGRLLPPPVHRALVLEREATTSRVERVAGALTLFGFRAVDLAGPPAVLATPAREGELDLERRRRDLAVLVLFATALGGLGALWLSGIAARQLAQPISALRGAALAIAGGEREPRLTAEPTAEFRPVFAAFRRMATDLAESRGALEAAQRRTAAVLRNVASGVVAVDAQGCIALANPRAESLLETTLEAGAPFADAARAAAPELPGLVAAFLAAPRDEEAFELVARERQLRGRITRLASGGAVVTLDDVTALARAQRVLAWGEMARQVAHEIKNPLTPIRLGVQHLRRAYATRRDEYESILDTNVGRILGEIDRLDEIARAFSRYGTAPAEREPAEPTDVSRVVRDVVALESMGESGVSWRVEGADAPLVAMARAGELRDVLVNLLENARLAQARTVTVRLDGRDDTVRITVTDDGEGIPADVLSRVFEPHFSTRTSGSGLGLAISRRLIDGWGGRIDIASTSGEGTEVRIELRPG